MWSLVALSRASL